MAWFMIGSREVEIQVQGPSVTYERIGPVYRTYGGGFRSQVRAQKKIWQGSTPPVLWAEADLIVAEIGLGITTIGGEWPGATIPVNVEIVNDVPVKDDRELVKGAQRILTLKAAEI